MRFVFNPKRFRMIKLFSKILFQILILIFFLLSNIFLCLKAQEIKTFELKRSFDLKKNSSINSIKLFNNSLLLLDATNSELVMLDTDSLYTIMKLNIKNRAFLQDFDISDSLFYFSNTYDEIFILDENSNFLDTIRITNPNRIILVNEKKMIITERISKSLKPKIIISNLKDKFMNITINNEKNKSVIEKIKPIFYSDIVQYDKVSNILYLFSNRTKELYSISSNYLESGFKKSKITTQLLNTFIFNESKFKFLKELKFGNFYFNRDQNYLLIVATNSKNNKNYIMRYKKSDENNFNLVELKIFNEKFDITTCYINNKNLIAYDYLNQKLLFYKFL